MPRSGGVPNDWQAKKPPRSCKVAALTTRVLGAAMPCRRAARLGVSPSANCSCRVPPPTSPTTTSPVWTPRRTASCTPRVCVRCVLSCPRASTIPGPYRPLGVIFVRQGVAEVDEQAVAEVLGNMPLIASDHLGTGLLIGAHHV